MKIKTLAPIIISGVIFVVIVYATLLIALTWPISEISINKAGVFGDSFGLLTSLFSGLAFSGMIITVLLQRDELKLQRQELEENRKEFSKSAIAQERSAQLSALSSMLNECDAQIKKVEDELENAIFLKDDVRYQNTLRDEGIIEKEISTLKQRKESIMTNIENILKNTGVII